LAAKLKLKTVSKVYQKFGINLKCQIPNSDKEIDFSTPDLKVNLKDFKGNLNRVDTLRVVDWELRTLNFFNYVCASCGSGEDLQVHHLKHIKTIDADLSGIDKQMAAINRKQITLCSSCHLKVHSGKYDGMALSHLEEVKNVNTP